MGEKPYILWFDEIGLDDLPFVGGKNASLGEMRRELAKQGVNVPNGFAVTVNAYHALLEEGIVQDWQEGKGKPRSRKVFETYSPVSMSKMWKTFQREEAGFGGSSIVWSFPGRSSKRL